MSETATVSSPPSHDPSLINNTPLNCITNVTAGPSTSTLSASSPTSATLNAQNSNQAPNTPSQATTSNRASRVEEQRATEIQDGSQAAAATPAIVSSTQTASETAAVVTRSNSTSSPSGRAPLKSCLIRLASDLRSLEADPVGGIDASPVDGSNLLYWRAAVFGPADTEWEGGIFQLNLNFPPDYPQKPPHVMFSTKIYHPNVFSDGTLCLDIIQDKWSPVYTVSTILTSVQSLLTDPNTSSPANSEAARLFATDKKEYRKRVRSCVAKCTSL